MRMPIFRYLLVVGCVLTGLLLWFGNESQPIETASSQMVGITTFKPEPEPEHARATAVNFAAEYKHPETKRVIASDMLPKRATTISSFGPPTRNRVAEFSHDNLSIH